MDFLLLESSLRDAYISIRFHVSFHQPVLMYHGVCIASHPVCQFNVSGPGMIIMCNSQLYKLNPGKVRTECGLGLETNSSEALPQVPGG